MPFLGKNARFFVLESNERKGKNKKKTTKIINKEGLGPKDHLTWALKPSKQKTKQNKTKTKKAKKKKETKKTKKKHKNTQKNFSIISQVFPFWWVSKISFFWQLGKKSAHPQNTIKIGVSETHYGKQFWVTKRPFLDKKQNPEIPVIIFIFAFFFSCNNKFTKIAETPIFKVF